MATRVHGRDAPGYPRGPAKPGRLAVPAARAQGCGETLSEPAYRDASIRPTLLNTKDTPRSIRISAPRFSAGFATPVLLFWWLAWGLVPTLAVADAPNGRFRR